MLKLNATTYQQVIKDNPKDRLEIIVGDDKQPDFKPQVKICRWGTSEDTNEVNLSIRAQEEVGATLKELPNGTIVYEAKEYEVHQYDKPDASSEGGFEFEWVLKSKPASNILTATIQSKGLDFFYQPALTPEEIAEGAQRPENVIGSYAVYHSTKGGMNDAAGMEYKVGKFCHIYRPKAIDANGVEVWADLLIENGVLTVTVPQKFLDDAVYPVRVDPTFGYTTIGAGSATFTSIAIGGTKGTLTEQGIISKLTTYFKAIQSGAAYRGALYSVAGVYEGNETEEKITPSINVWTDFNFSSPPTKSAADYYLAFWNNNSSISSMANDTGSSAQLFDNSLGATYPNWPTVDGLTSTNIKSIYATYTASGGTAVKDIIQAGFIPFAR